MNTRKAYQNVVGLILAVVSFMSLLGIACDDGGTINPDAGCIGQGASMTSCNELINSLP